MRQNGRTGGHQAGSWRRRGTTYYGGSGSLLITMGVVDMGRFDASRMEKWVQTVADGAIRVLFRVSRVRS